MLVRVQEKKVETRFEGGGVVEVEAEMEKGLVYEGFGRRRFEGELFFERLVVAALD